MVGPIVIYFSIKHPLTDTNDISYTIDIMYEDGKPWIVELNDNPGISDISVQPFIDDYFKFIT